MTLVGESDAALGEWAHALARELWPLPRSLTGGGVRKTIDILAREMPGLTRHSVPTGYRAFDWEVPREWNLKRAWIETPDGRVICDTDVHNLHVVGYSTPGEWRVTLGELKEHLYTEPDLPDAIPYVTSYYADRWGFCLPERDLQSLPEGTYRAVVDATLEPGQLDYADLVLAGESDREILVSTYLCHPSMANNELSGIVVAVALSRIVAALPRRHYTYRFVFVPETIGSLVYLSSRLGHFRDHVDAGFILTCVGDEGPFSYLASRQEDTLADRLALRALQAAGVSYRRYSFLDRGSDERQYCAPGIELPVCSVMKSKYGTFPEYHTSLDDLEFVTPLGLSESISVFRRIIDDLENTPRPRTLTLGEPQLGRRGLYSTLSRKGSAQNAMLVRNVLAYADGRLDLEELSAKIGVPVENVRETVTLLQRHGLVSVHMP
ncbi:DUF4910 domain-containing protein [Silicimonas sp. MF1-12-2]|uniref:DUF4910 domain-containing protein n=1 Tax=Silicimonas sp. MF1-12-2 TaxID=3384793 RepID=UPI0039B5ED54